MNYVDNPFESPAVLSICPGILGLERGLIRAVGPIRTLAYVEIEAFAVENLLAGMEAGILAPAPIWTNVRTFPPYTFRHVIDILIGGYPCQPFSTAGKRGGVYDSRHLWPHIENIIGSVRPLCCFFENVSGHLSLGFSEVRQSLSDMGYAVEAGIFTAEEVGAPHQRERLFILAILADAQGAGIRGRLGDLCEKNGRQDGSMQFVPDSASNKMAHSYILGTEGRYREFQNSAENIEGKENQRQRGGDESFNNRPTMADTDCSGLQKQRNTGEQAAQGDDRVSNAGADRWPAGPGQAQYSWESPRTIERGMGCRINGYNFREDLLRALGNSVVEQTAELAFRTLLMKHMK